MQTFNQLTKIQRVLLNAPHKKENGSEASIINGNACKESHNASKLEISERECNHVVFELFSFSPFFFARSDAERQNRDSSKTSRTHSLYMAHTPTTHTKHIK